MPPRWPGEARRPGYGGIGSQMAVQRELAAVGHLPRCQSAPSPFLELLPFFAGSGCSLTGEAQGTEAVPPSPGFSFSQIWRGGRRVVERRGPGPALRDGGSMKSADGGASVRCGGSLDWKLAGGGVSVGCGGSHVPPMFRWWIRMGRRTTAVGGSERKLSPILWASSGYAFKRGNPPEGIVELPLPPRQEALGENLVQDFGRMTMASFGVATLMRALF
uniref:Uncharacterized protein n=1 Tax=Oryza meridionalis TaxID=40149 RepID=A0A0E0EX22_9ORYZ